MTAIEFTHLTLAFTHKAIISQFNAAIREGEFVGIFGANGSGKTTLLRAILGLLKPSAGDITVLGKSACRSNPVIGYMPQLREYRSANQLSGWEYVSSAFKGHCFGFPHLNKEQRLRIHHIIGLVGAGDYIHRPYQQLSGGERQRLALAQALIDQPQILLLDEPLSGLDPGQQEKILALISLLQRELNMTVLLTAHDFNPLLNVMQRLIYLASGKAAIGTIEEIVTSDKLSWLYDAPIEVFRHQHRLFVIHKLSGSPLYDSHHH
jgi:zinc/manganese transport system ATP-binding protein